jgi:type IV secretory pathway VirB2 component (pilin)
MKRIMAPLLFLLLLIVAPIALADVDFNQDLTQDEKDQVDAILAPVMKVYNVIKYTATVIGVLVIVFAGITFITSSGDRLKKEKAKHMGIGVVVGLIVIWVAPLVVKLVFS